MNLTTSDESSSNHSGEVWPSLSLIIPVFNGEDNLPLFHHNLNKELSTLNQKMIEIIYVNDGSTDKSWQIIKNLNCHYANVECLNLSRCFGKNAAITAGLDFSFGDAVIILDAELRLPLNMIQEMLKAWCDGYDVVNITPALQSEGSMFKHLFAFRNYNRLKQRLDKSLLYNHKGFSLLSRRVVDVIKKLPERNRQMGELISWVGFKNTTLTYQCPLNTRFEKSLNLFKHLSPPLLQFANFSERLLKYSIWGGSVLLMIGLLSGAWVALNALVFDEVAAGHKSLMLLQLTVSGAQLLIFGFLGSYIGRIYTESKKRPVYIIMDIDRTISTSQKRKIHG